jgi:hypothetical protein
MFAKIMFLLVAASTSEGVYLLFSALTDKSINSVQLTSAVALALALAVIPYVFARACQEMAR